MKLIFDLDDNGVETEEDWTYKTVLFMVHSFKATHKELVTVKQMCQTRLSVFWSAS